MIKAIKVKNRVFWSLFLLFAPVCLCYLFPCSFFSSMIEHDNSAYIEGDTYLIDTNTILNAIKNSDANIFTLQTISPENEVEALPSVRWSQTDFIKVVTSFQQMLVSKTDNKPKFDRMSFEIKNCKNIDFGPQRAQIFAYKLKSGIFVWPPFKAESYSYFIDLNYNEIDWHGSLYDQYALQRHSVLDLTKIKITAEDALRIAELNGGKDARLSVDDRCSIDIEIDANSNNGNWIVTYGSSVTLLRMEINKANGQFIVRARGEEGNYEFDSQTILDSLKSGNKDVFKKIAPSTSDASVSQHVQWTQDDYYRVADAFMETVWKERLNDWNLYGLYFESNCHDASLGPQLVTFFIFRRGVSDEYHHSGRIDIKAGQNILTWTKTEDENIQYLLEKERTALDWAEIKISADKALQIVEEQGGKNLRIKLKLDTPNRNCQIVSWLNKWAAQTRTEWDISYYRSSTQGLLSAFVDAETGIHRLFFYEKVP